MLGSRSENITDHSRGSSGEGASIRSRIRTTHIPRRNATWTVCTAAGSSSDSVLQDEIAAAASDPVHKPST